MTKIPDPIPGLVISYSYLWKREFLEGREEGVKERPCAIILSNKVIGDDMQVTVAAVTHSPPDDAFTAVEIPWRVKEHLDLDSEKSWVICDEVNRFIWSGPDLRFIANQKQKKYSYGILPPKLFKDVTQTLIKNMARIVIRTK